MPELTKEEIDIITNVIPEADMIPSNAPKLEELDQWQARVGKWFNKLDPTGKVLQKGVIFEPTNLFPEHNIEKNTVKYRYHVRVHLGFVRSKNGEVLDGSHGKPHVVKMAHRKDGSCLDFMMDVEKFLKDYKPL